MGNSGWAATHRSILAVLSAERCTVQRVQCSGASPTVPTACKLQRLQPDPDTMAERTAYKGIILAGGSGTRLHPLTTTVSKQLMPVYDKPMVYYPLATLMLAGIRDILVITTPRDQLAYVDLLGDGNQWGINLQYTLQASPDGLAQAFLLAEEFIDRDPVCLVLGDNIFYGDRLSEKLQRAAQQPDGATVFAFPVDDPEKYGVVEFDSNFKAISIEEKPDNPKSNYAIPGLYFYDNSVVDIAKNLDKSDRGEYEITDVNKYYLDNNSLEVILLEKGSVWLDTGTFDSLSQANLYVSIIEKRQGRKIGCIEENCLEQGFISKQDALSIGNELSKTEYGKYLIRRAKKWI